MHYNYVVIGSSAAGMAALETLRKLNNHASIACISAENSLPYNKCFLVDYIAGCKTKNDLYLKKIDFFAEKQISYFPNMIITAIESNQNQITSKNGVSISYDRLLIATGVRPRLPHIQGMKAKGVAFFHTLKDIAYLDSFINHHNVQSAAIVGAGLTGVECADALSKRGIQVSIIDQTDHILPKYATPDAAAFLSHNAQKKGVECIARDSIVSIQANQGFVSTVTLQSGKILKVQLVVLTAGVQPNIECVPSDIKKIDNYIEIDETCATSIPNIYAAGDVTLTVDQISGKKAPTCMWADAMLQGLCAGYTMAGSYKKYPGTLPIVSSHFFEKNFYAYIPQNLTIEPMVYCNDLQYICCWLHDERVCGFIALGLPNAVLLKRYLMTQTKTSFTHLLKELL